MKCELYLHLLRELHTFTPSCKHDIVCIDLLNYLEFIHTPSGQRNNIPAAPGEPQSLHIPPPLPLRNLYTTPQLALDQALHPPAENDLLVLASLNQLPNSAFPCTFHHTHETQIQSRETPLETLQWCRPCTLFLGRGPRFLLIQLQDDALRAH